MKMLIILVMDHLADDLTRAYTDAQYRVTRIASTSGFLRSGIVTLLVGVEKAQVDAAIKVARSALAGGAAGEKRATVFVVPVENFEQI